MKKLFFIVLTAVILLWGCDSLGEDPLPSPGPNADGSVTLFVNGSIYNFDYTAQYDGIQLLEYIAPARGGKGGAFSNLGSSEGGGFSGKPGSIYTVEGNKALEFSHDLRYNTPDGETWRITLFDAPPILLADYNSIVFWAKYAWPPEPYETESGQLFFPKGKASITISAETGRGYLIKGIENTFTEEDMDNGQWRKFIVPLDSKYYFVSNPEFPNDRGKDIKIPIPPDDTLKTWSIHVPADAGRIYVDEIVLMK